jgi:hypothetical protein
VFIAVRNLLRYKSTETLLGDVNIFHMEVLRISETKIA